MSLGRRVTFTVILTLVMSALSSVFCTPEAGGNTPTEKPLSSKPVALGPPISHLPAKEIGTTISTLPSPTTQMRKIVVSRVKKATAVIVTRKPVVPVQSAIPVATGGNAQPVIDFAMAQLGDPYLWGGNGPNSWDCSGLMVGAFRQAGVNLPRTSRAQFTVGTPVEYGQWQPGDLLFYGQSAGSIHHVVMYVGGGQIIHAPQAGDVVKLASAPNGGGRDYLGAKRVL